MDLIYGTVIYLFFFSLMASGLVYWIYRTIGKKQKEREMIRRKGVIDTKDVLAVLPVERREARKCNFHRWLLPNIFLVLDIVVLQVLVMKHGMEHVKPWTLVVVPCFYLLCQTITWYQLLRESMGGQILTVIIILLSLIAFLLLNCYYNLSRFWKSSVFEGTFFSKAEEMLSCTGNFAGMPMIVVSVVWLLVLIIAFPVLNRKRHAWME